jgi:hypothetical protein
MPVQKIKSGRIITVEASTYVGEKGIIFYDEDTPELRLSDGITPGGILFTGGTGTGTFTLLTATTVRLGGVKIGANIIASADGTISVAPIPTNLSQFNNDLGFVSSSSLTWNNISGKPTFSVVSTSGSYTDLINTPTIPTSLTDLGITDGTSGQVLTTDGSGNFSFTTVTTTASVASLNDIGNVNIVNIQDNQTLVYNSSTSNFENVSLNLTGGTANQILVKKSGSNYDYQWEELNITLPSSQVYTKLIDDASTTSTLYLGEAQPESVESDPVWRIQKIVFDASGNVDSVRFAGTGTFTQIWDNRTSLTYL